MRSISPREVKAIVRDERLGFGIGRNNDWLRVVGTPSDGYSQGMIACIEGRCTRIEPSECRPDITSMDAMLAGLLDLNQQPKL